MVALVDTNVVLDMLAKREPWYQSASDLLFLCAAGKCQLALSANTVTDIYYLIHKHIYHDHAKCRDVIAQLLEFFSVIDVGFADCSLALASAVKDYEDAVLVEAARRAQVDCIITRDFDDFAAAALRVFTPAQYLQQFVG